MIDMVTRITVTIGWVALMVALWLSVIYSDVEPRGAYT